MKSSPGPRHRPEQLLYGARLSGLNNSRLLVLAAQALRAGDNRPAINYLMKLGPNQAYHPLIDDLIITIGRQAVTELGQKAPLVLGSFDYPFDWQTDLNEASHQPSKSADQQNWGRLMSSLHDLDPQQFPLALIDRLIGSPEISSTLVSVLTGSNLAAQLRIFVHYWDDARGQVFHRLLSKSLALHLTAGAEKRVLDFAAALNLSDQNTLLNQADHRRATKEMEEALNSCARNYKIAVRNDNQAFSGFCDDVADEVMSLRASLASTHRRALVAAIENCWSHSNRLGPGRLITPLINRPVGNPSLLSRPPERGKIEGWLDRLDQKNVSGGAAATLFQTDLTSWILNNQA